MPDYPVTQIARLPGNPNCPITLIARLPGNPKCTITRQSKLPDYPTTPIARLPKNQDRPAIRQVRLPDDPIFPFPMIWRPPGNPKWYSPPGPKRLDAKMQRASQREKEERVLGEWAAKVNAHVRNMQQYVTLYMPQ